MIKLKKLMTVGTVIIAMGATTVTVMAAQGRGANTAIRRQDGTYITTGTRPGTGRGAGGTGKLQGIGGLGLQDGSCYITTN